VLSGLEESILIGCNPIDSLHEPIDSHHEAIDNHHEVIDSHGAIDSYGAIISYGAVVGCMIIVCAPYYCIPYVLYCSGDAVALCIRMTCFYFLICGGMHDHCMCTLLLHPVCFVLLK
jgi:hypothetical protein